MRRSIAMLAVVTVSGGCLSDAQTIGAVSHEGSGGGTGRTTAPSSTGSSSNAEVTASAEAADTQASAGSTGALIDCSPQDAFVPSPYVWIPQSVGGAMLKYDAATMEEVGRYAMRPYDMTSLSRSRVSVNLNGDVVVSNRAGGVSMFYGNRDDCPEQNGIAGLQTSSAAGELLPWDEEECRGWYTEFQANSQRPVAWTSGTLDPETCRFEGAQVWTSRTRWEGVVQVFRLDGEDGSVVEMLDVPEMDPQEGWIGSYGGAVDHDNDFWIVGRQDSAPTQLCEITYEALDVRCWPVPAEVMNYGFTLDRTGRAWLGGSEGNVARFDPQTEVWDVVNVGGQVSGVQEAQNGDLWFGAYDPSGFTVVDPESLAVVDFVAVAPGAGARGVAIDHLGQAWGFCAGDRLVRYRPSDGQLIEVKEVYPYVHSDNVGLALMLTALGG